MNHSRILPFLLLCSAAVNAQNPGAEWLHYNNDLMGQRFSNLEQITPENASQLGQVCRVQVDGPTSFHSGLIVNDGVIFATTSRKTIAVDALT